MIIYNLVDFREYLENETNENYHIVYEKVESIEANLNNNNLLEKKQGFYETIKILKGTTKNDSLRCIYTEELGTRCNSVEAIVNTIRKEHKYIF